LALSGVSPYQWRFGKADIISVHGRNDILEPSQSDGATVIQSVGRDPHFWLESGRLIDLRGYPLLSLSIHAQAADQLEIYLSCANHPPFSTTHGTGPVHLDAGHNELVFNLAEGRLRSFSGGPCLGSAYDSLRIDPGEALGNRFILRWLQLQSPTSPAHAEPVLRMDYAQAIKGPELPHFSASGRPLIIENVSTLAPPEWNRHRAQQIYLRNPSAILFSGPLPDRLQGVVDGTESPSPRPQVSLGGIGGVSALMLIGMALAMLMAAWLWRAKRIIGHRTMIFRRLLDRPRFQLALVITASLLAFQIIPYSVSLIPLLAASGVAFLTIILLLLRRGAPPALPPSHWSWLPRDIRAWRDTVLLSGVLVLLLLGVSAIAPPPVSLDIGSLAIHASRYTLWALLQQLILGPLLLARIHALNPDPWRAIAVAAMIFSAFHFPNFALMQVTLLAGLVWGWLYLRYRAVLPLAISHGILGSLFEHLLPEYLRWSGKVGIGYFQAMGL
jgi:membrane protease YdiL (CAAX protease family)